MSLRAGDFDPTSIRGAVTLDHVNDAVVLLEEEDRLKLQSVITAEMGLASPLVSLPAFHDAPQPGQSGQLAGKSAAD